MEQLYVSQGAWNFASARWTRHCHASRRSTLGLEGEALSYPHIFSKKKRLRFFYLLSSFPSLAPCAAISPLPCPPRLGRRGGGAQSDAESLLPWGRGRGTV